MSEIDNAVRRKLFTIRQIECLIFGEVKEYTANLLIKLDIITENEIISNTFPNVETYRVDEFIKDVSYRYLQALEMLKTAIAEAEKTIQIGINVLDDLLRLNADLPKSLTNNWFTYLEEMETVADQTFLDVLDTKDLLTDTIEIYSYTLH